MPPFCHSSRQQWLHRVLCRVVEPAAKKPILRLCVERQLLQIFKYQEGLHCLPAAVLQQVDPPVRNLRRNGRHHRELKLAYDNLTGPDFHPTMRVTLDQLPLAYSVYAWNSIPAEVADLSAADLQVFKRHIQGLDLFSSLENKRRQEGRSIPTLMCHYLNL